LEVILLWQIGGDHSFTVEGEPATDVARIYFCKVVGGELKDTDESKSQGWFSLEDLSSIKLVTRPCKGHYEGRTKTMIVDALKSGKFNSFI